jgi:hypothetical protein
MPNRAMLASRRFSIWCKHREIKIGTHRFRIGQWLALTVCVARKGGTYMEFQSAFAEVIRVVPLAAGLVIATVITVLMVGSRNPHTRKL